MSARSVGGPRKPRQNSELRDIEAQRKAAAKAGKTPEVRQPSSNATRTVIVDSLMAGAQEAARKGEILGGAPIDMVKYTGPAQAFVGTWTLVDGYGSERVKVTEEAGKIYVETQRGRSAYTLTRDGRIEQRASKTYRYGFLKLRKATATHVKSYEIRDGRLTRLEMDYRGLVGQPGVYIRKNGGGGRSTTDTPPVLQTT